MAIVDDILKLDQQLSELISKYEQYFIGLEKREPLPLLGEVQKIVRRYTGVLYDALDVESLRGAEAVRAKARLAIRMMRASSRWIASTCSR